MESRGQRKQDTSRIVQFAAKRRCRAACIHMALGLPIRESTNGIALLASAANEPAPGSHVGSERTIGRSSVGCQKPTPFIAGPPAGTYGILAP